MKTRIVVSISRHHGMRNYSTTPHCRRVLQVKVLSKTLCVACGVLVASSVLCSSKHAIKQAGWQARTV
jgi:hypothetical protein